MARSASELTDLARYDLAAGVRSDGDPEAAPGTDTLRPLEILTQINPEPAYPLAADGWDDWLEQTARELARRLLGRVPIPLKGSFLRVMRGRIYAAPLDPLPWSLLPGFEPGRLEGAASRAGRALLAVPWVVWTAIRMSARLRALEAGAAPAFAACAAEMARHPIDALPHLPSDRLLGYGLDLEGSSRFRAAWLATNVLNTYGAAVGEILLGILREVLEDWADDDGSLYLRAIGGVGGLESLAANEALCALAALPARNAGLRRALEGFPATGLDEIARLPDGADFVRELESFLRRYGHRGPGEGSGLAPRWSDRPELVLGLVRSLSASERERHRHHPESTPARVLAEVEERLRRPRAPRLRLIAWLLERVHHALRIRENSKHQLVAHSQRLRRTALEAGRRLRESGLLDSATDSVLYLERAELVRALRGQEDPAVLAECVRRRRAQREAWIEAERSARGAEGSGATRGDRGDTLVGTAASPGVGEGPARVVLDPATADDFAEGSVLVAPYTDTAWTPLFHLASAVVVESGSVLSHAAIVAREIGVPCSVQVPDATRRIADGDWLRVDGGRGTVQTVP